MRFAAPLVAVLPPVLLVLLLAPIQYGALSAPLLSRLKALSGRPKPTMSELPKPTMSELPEPTMSELPEPTMSELVKNTLVDDHLSLLHYDRLVEVATKPRDASQEDIREVIAAIKFDRVGDQPEQTDVRGRIGARQRVRQRPAMNQDDLILNLGMWYRQRLIWLMRLKFELALLDAVLKAGKPADPEGLGSLMFQIQVEFNEHFARARADEEKSLGVAMALDVLRDEILRKQFPEETKLQSWFKEAFGLLELGNTAYLKALQVVHGPTQQQLEELREAGLRRQQHQPDAFTPRRRPRSGNGQERYAFWGATSRSEIEPLIDRSDMSTGPAASSTPVQRGGGPTMQRQDSAPLIDFEDPSPTSYVPSYHPFEAGQSRGVSSQQRHRYIPPPWDF